MYYSGDINEPQNKLGGITYSFNQKHIIDTAFEEVILRTMYNFAIIIVTESISHLIIQKK